ncbi:MAG: NAD(P)/FAD-dependent oxidoreductase [Hyphomonadaceae bacterium]|nr:NAD(P)/FAD-dependent oxidoreductase [Hyphomonadaceae bacterium]
MNGDVYDLDCLVIGAGAVGLACAVALARAGREVLVIEAGAAIGAGLSSRNSEVIHAGIYYPRGSLKHRLCIEGRRALYAYLAMRGVAHRRCGKLIVATDAAEERQIAALEQRARDNEVEGCQLIGGAQARALEPNLVCTSALVSAETGILDSHGYMLALQGDLEDASGAIAFNTACEGGALLSDGSVEVRLSDGARVRCGLLVNAAGLMATRVAAAIEGAPAPPALTLAKGSYFGCAGRPAFSRLIYPAPVDGGLGVHLTLDLAGRMRFGPDVEWLDEDDPARVDYAVDPRRADAFYAAIRRYWPALPYGALTPDYAGCRPKLSRKGEAAADFAIARTGGLINLFGVESPGLTASPAIGAYVAALARA